MAKIKYSGLVSEMRGKLNGGVLSRNRGGAYVRNKVTPLNPQTDAQVNVRNFFTTNSKAWRGLLQSVRNAWNSAVSGFISTDIFGDGLTPSGANLYQRINTNLLNINESVLTNPPTPAAVPSFLTFSVAIDHSDGTAFLSFTDPIAVTEKVLLYATPGLSPGKAFAKNNFRLIGVLDNSFETGDDAASLYIAKFGAIPAPGQKVFFKAKQITISNGLNGAVSECFTIVVT